MLHQHADKIERIQKQMSKSNETMMELEREQNKEVESYPGVLSMTGERDPVRAYDLYASKRPDDLKTPDSPFYLAINHTTKAVNTKPWFKSAPMGVNKLKSLMKTMAEKAGLDAKNLTNHSGRKRMIQKLNDEGVPPTHIMQISGHKNVQSLNNYSTLSERQQKKHLQHSEWISRSAGVIGIPSRYFQCFDSECN